MGDNILVTTNLSKIYSKKKVLDDINLTVKKGDIYGLVGKNGAGKTTLIRIVLSLIKQSSGYVELFGESLGKDNLTGNHSIGSIVETPAFYSYFTAAENLEFYRIQKGIPEKESINEVLEIVGLEDTENKKFKNFSLGMKQRLGLALAILGKPELLILDEPINALDPVGIKEVRDILVKLNTEYNTTVLISSHILGELSRVATCYGFINNGQLVEEVSSDDLKNKCKDCIRVKVDNYERAIKIIEEKLNCRNYSKLPDNEIDIYGLLDRPQEINRALVTNGVDVFSLQSSGNSLEEYYFKLIGGSQNA